MKVTDDDVATYEQNGFVVLQDALGPAAVQDLRQALDTWPGRDAANGPYGILKNNLWHEVPYVTQLITEAALPRAACRLLRATDVVLFQDNLVWKPPGGARIEWHQDFSYWPLNRPVGVTLWIAVDDADVANGCMHYLAGTHLMGECQPADFIAGAGQPARPNLPRLDWEDRQVDAVAAAVTAGQILVHHPLVWHMSPANQSDRPRRALTLTWIGADVRWDPTHAPHPYTYQLQPAAGQPVAGHLFPRFAGVTAGTSS